jgi:hypothetical protein
MSSLVVNRGSDAEFVLTWKDENGDPVDLTGKTVTVFDEIVVGTCSKVRGPNSGDIANRITGEVTDGPNGIVTLYLEGTNPIRVGKYAFRVQLNNQSGEVVSSLATPLIGLEIR